jgi:hypothetical protein
MIHIFLKENVLRNLLNYYGSFFNWAGYPAIFSIRYLAGYPARQIRFPAGYQMSKKAGLSGRIYPIGRISGASL